MIRYLLEIVYAVEYAIFVLWSIIIGIYEGIPAAIKTFKRK